MKSIFDEFVELLYESHVTSVCYSSEWMLCDYFDKLEMKKKTEKFSLRQVMDKLKDMYQVLAIMNTTDYIKYEQGAEILPKIVNFLFERNVISFYERSLISPPQIAFEKDNGKYFENFDLEKLDDSLQYLYVKKKKEAGGIVKKKPDTENSNDIIPIAEIYEIQPCLDYKENELTLGVEIKCMQDNRDESIFFLTGKDWNKNDVLLIVNRLCQLRESKTKIYDFAQVCKDVGVCWDED